MASDVKYESHLGRYAASMDRRNDRALDRLGSLGEKVARSRARVLTGRMRSRIRWADRVDTLKAGAPYTAYMENGTRYVRAQPMLGPAEDAMAARAGDVFQDEFDPAL